jgi:biotin carboxylase
VPVMQITAAAADVCDLLWLIDGSIPEMQQMTELLNRFGPVVNVHGLDADGILKELVDPYRPQGIVTYLDANMTTYARVAETLGLPFFAPTTAVALTDKAEQRRVMHAAGLAVPQFVVIEPGRSEIDPANLGAKIGWPAVLKPRSAQGSRYTFFVKDASHLNDFLEALGPERPEMILERYLADDPARQSDPYAAYVSVESVASRGTVSHFALTGRFPLAENFRETGFFIPAAIDAHDCEDVLTLARSAVEALGVAHGFLHTEIKFTPDGPRVIEVNGRIGGGVPEMIGRAADLPVIALTLRLALGEDIHFDGPVATTRIGYRFFLQPPAVSATVASISGLDTVSDYPGVDAISVHQRPGADLDWKDGSRNHIVAVVGSANSYEELRAVDRLLNQEVTVTYANVSHG